MAKKSVHDMGGDRAGPIDRHEHVPTLTEKRIDALMGLMRAKPRAFWVTDENRRTIESLTPDIYNTSGYYEKWAYAMRALLSEKGVLSAAEIATRLAQVKARLGAGKGGRATGAPGKKPTKTPAAKKPAAKTSAAKRPAGKKAAGKRGKP